MATPSPLGKKIQAIGKIVRKIKLVVLPKTLFKAKRKIVTTFSSSLD